MARYIDADLEIIKILNVIQEKQEKKESDKFTEEVLFAFVNALKKAPAANVEPVRHGRLYQGLCDDDWSCSICHASVYFSMSRPWFKFCPNCGAKMDMEK